MVYTICKANSVLKVENVSVLKEIFVAFIASVPFFTQGIETVFLTSSIHPGHFIYIQDVPWTTTAFILAAAASGLVFSYCMNKIGRKLCIFAISIVQGASLIPLFLLNSTSTIVLHVLAGISTGGIFTVLPVYVSEITSIRIRGPCLALMLVLTCTGYMMKLALELEAAMYLMTTVVMAQLVTMIGIVETPGYFIRVGELEKAKKSIAYLKSLEESSPILPAVLETLKKERERALSIGISIRQFYRHKIWWDAFKIAIILPTITGLCGNIVFLSQDDALKQLQIDGDEQNVLVLVSMFVGSLFGFLTVMVADYKYILTICYSIMTLSSGVVAVFTQHTEAPTESWTQWLPIVFLVTLVFAYGIAWGLPLLVLVELFNLEIRAAIIGTVFTYSQLLKLFHVHTFKYVKDYVGTYTALYMFAGINLCGAVYSIFFVPNIRKKTLKQIERQLKRPPLLS